MLRDNILLQVDHQAVFWFQKAAEQGDLSAQVNLRLAKQCTTLDLKCSNPGFSFNSTKEN
jgi:TPR repeat protein